MIKEMEQLCADYNVNGFYFNDDTFVLDRKRVFEFCRLIGDSGLKVVWYCNGRVNLMTREMLEAIYSDLYTHGPSANAKPETASARRSSMPSRMRDTLTSNTWFVIRWIRSVMMPLSFRPAPWVFCVPRAGDG